MHREPVVPQETERAEPGAERAEPGASSLISLIVHWNARPPVEQWVACRGNGFHSQTSLGWNHDPNSYQFCSLGKFSLSLSQFSHL